MDGYYKQLIKILKKNGCYFVRNGSGSHEIWYSPITDQNFTVSSNLPIRHMANKILKKDAGIQHRF